MFFGVTNPYKLHFLFVYMTATIYSTLLVSKSYKIGHKRNNISANLFQQILKFATLIYLFIKPTLILYGIKKKISKF